MGVGVLVTHGPERLMTDIGSSVLRTSNIESIMPLDVETELLNRLLIG